MKELLSELKNKICVFKDLDIKVDEDDQKFQDFIKNTWVIFPAGGKGLRLREITGPNVNKNVLLIDDDLTIIERTLLMYREAGLKNFVIWILYNIDSVKSVLGDGSKYGVNIHYSLPPIPGGRGAAMLNSLQKEILPKDVYSICHNPVDQIVAYPTFVMDILRQHYYNSIHADFLATIVVAEETPYHYSALKIENNLVREFSKAPMIPIPAHIGVTCFSPKSYDYFVNLFELSDKADFESKLFPILVKEGKLAAVKINSEQWIPVKNNDNLKRLRRTINKR